MSLKKQKEKAGHNLKGEGTLAIDAARIQTLQARGMTGEVKLSASQN